MKCLLLHIAHSNTSVCIHLHNKDNKEVSQPSEEQKKKEKVSNN